MRRLPLHVSAQRTWHQVPGLDDRAAPCAGSAACHIAICPHGCAVGQSALSGRRKAAAASSNARHYGASGSPHARIGEWPGQRYPGDRRDRANGEGQQSGRSQQMDLFDGATPRQTPAWPELPEETRGR